MSANEAQRIAAITAEVQRIDSAVEAASNDWDREISAARTVITLVDSTSLMQRVDRTDDQTFIIATLQRLAYYDADSGGIQDIANWCVTQWLGLLQRDNENVEALTGVQGSFPLQISPRSGRIIIGLILAGLGRGWLSRSQSALARIHRDEGSSSSGLSSGRPGTGSSAAYTSSDEARDAARAAAEADARVHTPDYVEARGILLPSTEHFSRAVIVAERRGSLTGELLAQVSIKALSS